jgi:hypothetical protein
VSSGERYVLDGFGSFWRADCPECGGRVYVLKPGKARCGQCDANGALVGMVPCSGCGLPRLMPASAFLDAGDEPQCEACGRGMP